MSDVPSNLIPTRVTQLPIAPTASEDSLMMIVYQGNNYQIRVGDLLSVAGVPTTRQVIAGTGMTGGGQLTDNVTLSIANGGVGTAQLASTGVSPGVYGSDTAIPVFTVDSTGRVTAATTMPITTSGYVPTTREVIAGEGLNGGGPLNANVTLNANLSDATPSAGDDSGSAGVSTDISRADHKHPAVDLGVDSEVDGVLGLDNGGTARSIVPDEGAIIWCGADGLYVGPVGTPGQVIQSTGAGEYIWVDQSTLDVGQADNLNGGAANRIPVQTAPNTTGFISAPTSADTFLKWNGSALIWDAVAGAGTVTSVDASGGTTGMTFTGGPITSSGTLTLSGTLSIANGGTGATDAATARTNLGLGTAAVLNAGVANGVATLDSGGTVPTSQLPAAVLGAVKYQGTWNASTNTPTLTSSVGTQGYYYVVDVAGSTNLNGVTDWKVGDWAIFNGSVWEKVDSTDAVTSVNGYTGTVVLTASDIGGGAALTRVDDTNVTLTLGGSPSSALLAATSLTLGWSGQLSVTRGGTGASTASGARTNLGAAASGANSDITSMSGLTGAISSPTYIQYGDGSGTTLAAGRMWYDQTTGSMNVGMGGGNITQQIGEEIFVYGKASAAITDSPLQIVYATGTVGASGVITFAPTASGITDGNLIIGVATENIALNGFGRITSFGVVHGITTNGTAYGEVWADGDMIWYNPATGNPTNVKPSAPNIKVQIGTIIKAGNGGSGSVQVEINHGSTLGGTDSNVQITSPTDNDLLQYYAAGPYWRNLAPSSVSVGTATNLAGGAANRIAYQTGAGATGFITAPSVANTFLEWSGSAFQWSSNPLGTVTSVDVSGGTTGLTFSGGPVTTSGTITMAGTLAIANGGTGTANGTNGGTF